MVSVVGVAAIVKSPALNVAVLLLAPEIGRAHV